MGGKLVGVEISYWIASVLRAKVTERSRSPTNPLGGSAVGSVAKAAWGYVNMGVPRARAENRTEPGCLNIAIECSLFLGPSQAPVARISKKLSPRAKGTIIWLLPSSVAFMCAACGICLSVLLVQEARGCSDVISYLAKAVTGTRVKGTSVTHRCPQD